MSTTPTTVFDTDLMEKAINFAFVVHSGQTRKLDNLPYTVHPTECALIAMNLTADVETICAAVLHDTVEDTDASIEQIEKIFGKRVAELVGGDTEDKLEHMSPSDSWKIRKEQSLKHLKNTKDIDVKIIWMADKLSNMRSMFNTYTKIGDDIWNHFNMKDKSMHKWYYDTIEEYLSDFKDTGPYEEYVLLKNTIFKEEVDNE